MDVHASIKLPKFDPVKIRSDGENFLAPQSGGVIVKAINDLNRRDMTLRVEKIASVSVIPGHGRSSPLSGIVHDPSAGCLFG
jgi:hypothetical protein